jgi:CRISPR system Cascade subunit CasA
MAFAELAEIDGDYAVAFEWPRPDFNVAAYEFVIGVMAVAFPLLEKGDWPPLWRKPPGRADVEAALSPLRPAFFLTGEGPRFLQEFDGIDGDEKPIEALLIDTPGENGQKKNADLLTHRRRYEMLGLPAAAMALYALQQFAPAGGAGNRTSLRGGGPMTNLVLPGDEAGGRPPLWRTVLANLNYDTRYGWNADDLPKILPWLAPTLTSDKAQGERDVSEEDDFTHPLQAFFGMPRRIVLGGESDGRCSMTGASGPCISSFVQKPWGVNYGLWLHPLTPYRRQKEGDDPYSVKPKSARFGYRDWAAVTIGAKNKLLTRSAKPVASAFAERAGLLQPAGAMGSRLMACGWAMNNMEAVAYLDAEQPMHLTDDPARMEDLEEMARSFADAADVAASILRIALRNALFADGAKPSTDAGLFEDARAAFYEATEDAFHDALDALLAEAALPDADAKDARRWRWLQQMAMAVEVAFERWAPIPTADPQRARRIVQAFGSMRSNLKGYGKSGRELFVALSLPEPEARRHSGKGRRRG